MAEAVVSLRYFFTMIMCPGSHGWHHESWGLLELECDMGAGKMAMEKTKSALGAYRVQPKHRVVTRKLFRVYKHTVMGQYMKRDCIPLPKAFHQFIIRACFPV